MSRYVTLLVCFPGRALFFHMYKVPEIIQELLAILSRNGITDNPVIAHVFSNGGSLIYSRFSAALHDPSDPKPRDLHLRLKGVVFDSAPSKWSLRMAVHSAMNTVYDSLLLRYGLGLGVLVSLLFLPIVPEVTDSDVDDDS